MEHHEQDIAELERIGSQNPFLADFESLQEVLKPVLSGGFDLEDLHKVRDAWWDRFGSRELELAKRRVAVQQRLMDLYRHLEHATPGEWKEYARVVSNNRWSALADSGFFQRMQRLNLEGEEDADGGVELVVEDEPPAAEQTQAEVVNVPADGDAGPVVETEPPTPEETQAPTHKEEIEATDAARREAQERDVNLTEIVGTGSGGKIIIADVTDFAKSQTEKVEPKASGVARRGAEEQAPDTAQQAADQAQDESGYGEPQSDQRG